MYTLETCSTSTIIWILWGSLYDKFPTVDPSSIGGSSKTLNASSLHKAVPGSANRPVSKTTNVLTIAEKETAQPQVLKQFNLSQNYATFNSLHKKYFFG